jgi:hypothetical protein
MGAPVHHHPGGGGGPAVAGHPRVRRARHARAAAAQPGRCVRLRRGRGREAADRWHRGAGPPARRAPAWAAGVCVRQEEAEHHQGNGDQRRGGPAAVAGRVPARPHARRDRGAHRRHRRPAAGHPDLGAEVDTGYQGLARDFPDQVSAPPKKPGKDASPEETTRWEQQRHQQSSQRICIEHAIAEPKQWRPLQRYLGRREHFQETALAIAGLVSDRAAAR